ncbi:MAG: carbohydrate ABC transporter permease [Ktedonobacterales bacterium]|nr:carbohydrate ABC transporter permease [Ktedonobacterales bacterium]
MQQFGIFRRGLGQRRQTDSHDRSIISALELRKPAVAIVHWLIFGVLCLGSVATIGPLLWMVSGALKPSIEIFSTPPILWPASPQWLNFVTAWQQLNSLRYLANTAILAGGAVVLQLLVSATAAYALSKLKPIFSNVMLFFFLSTLMVPAIAYLIPQYFTVIHLPILGVSLIGTWWAIWLPEAANAFNIIILKSFFDSIPNELLEAAKIDGANAWQIFTRIVLPNSLPALAVVAMFTIFATWKDFLWPLLVLNDPNTQPISVALYQQGIAQNSYQPQNVLLAGFVIATIPPLILFLIFQRQIMRGVVTTGLKG